MWGIEAYFVWVWVILRQCGFFWVGKGKGAFFWVSRVGCWCMGLYFGWVGVSGIEWSIVLCRGKVDGWETFFRWVRVGGSEGRRVEVGGCVGTVWCNASLKKNKLYKISWNFKNEIRMFTFIYSNFEWKHSTLRLRLHLHWIMILDKYQIIARTLWPLIQLNLPLMFYIHEILISSE